VKVRKSIQVLVFAVAALLFWGVLSPAIHLARFKREKISIHQAARELSPDRIHSALARFASRERDVGKVIPPTVTLQGLMSAGHISTNGILSLDQANTVFSLAETNLFLVKTRSPTSRADSPWEWLVIRPDGSLAYTNQ
jgi:hypothetical protein